MKKYTGTLHFSYDKIKTEDLEFFAYEFPGEEILLSTATEEFSCVCPWSSLPDFANLKIQYVPDKRCAELKSLKMYVVSFRDVGIFHEHATNRIHNDLWALLKPKYLKVVLEYKNRGGFVTTSTKERGSYAQDKRDIRPDHSRRG